MFVLENICSVVVPRAARVTVRVGVAVKCWVSR